MILAVFANGVEAGLGEGSRLMSVTSQWFDHAAWSKRTETSRRERCVPKHDDVDVGHCAQMSYSSNSTLNHILIM